VHTPDPLRDDPNHPHASLGPDDHTVGFRDGGLIPGEMPKSTDSVLNPGGIGYFADGGKVEKKERKKLGADDLGSGLASEAAKDLSGRELQLLNAERAAEGLPPLKKSKFADGGVIDGMVSTGPGLQAASPERAAEIFRGRTRDNAIRKHRKQGHEPKIERSAMNRFLFGQNSGYKTVKHESDEKREEHLDKLVSDSKRHKPAANQK
jgi:hypothetical protein